jgi:hypothetical protein
MMLSCNQDSIFADISVEPEPKDPRIAGSPVRLVEFNNRVWTAGRGSGKIHYYGDKGDGTIGWRTQASPGGAVVSLASTAAHLYVLCGNPVSGDIWKIDSSGDSTNISQGISKIQTIYSAGGKVFAGASTSADNKSWSVYYADDADTSLEPVPLLQNTGMLTGAAIDSSLNIYISTLGKGVFKFDFTATPPAPVRLDADGITPLPEDIVDKDDVPMTAPNVRGIMNTGIGADSIVAVTGNGYILWYDDVNSRFKAKSQGGPNFSGGMTLWKKFDAGTTSWIPALLLLGVQSSRTYNKGYREIDVDLSGVPLDSASPVEPGSLGPPANSSIARGDRSKYEASLYKYSVVSIMQVSDDVEPYPRDSLSNYVDPAGWQPLILASTINAGLQSLEDGLWNAEE